MNEILASPAILETERLLLRPFSLGDLEAIYKIFPPGECQKKILTIRPDYDILTGKRC